MLKEHRWIAKAMVQKAVSATGATGAYHIAQRLVGGLRAYSPKESVKWAMTLAADIGLDRLEGATAVEIGPGWVPIFPVVLHLLGVRRVISFDQTAHLQREITLRSIPAMREFLPEFAERLTALASLTIPALFHRIGFEYYAPADFTNSDIRGVDLIYSNAVLEHVTPVELRDIAEHSREILSQNGIIWHNIDYSDHYAHTFKDLSMINFLRYSERTWDAIGQSDLHYQNRLRRSDYVKAFKAAGFRIECVIDCMGVSEAEACSAPLAKRFAGRELSDLTATSSRFVLS